MTLEAAMASLGHSSLTVLKADIEAAEYDVFGFWDIGMKNLPKQISVELHYDGMYHGTDAFENPDSFSNLFWPMHKPTLAELSLFVGHLAGMGFGIVSKENNALCPYCCELTLLNLT
jgi:hypothetical protein